MKASEGTHFLWPLVVGGLVALSMLPGARCFAQADAPYRTGEAGHVSRDANGHILGPADPLDFSPGAEESEARDAPEAPDTPGAIDPAPPADAQNTGPVRMARFAFVSGNVNWRVDDKGEWSPATVNLPIREGAQVWVKDDGQADVQFDDGSELRLGHGALATLKVLFSDKDGEFTQVSMNDGLATLYSRHDNAVYQVDTPAVSVKSKGTSQIRFGIDNGSEITVQRGEAIIDGPHGKLTMHSGDYVYLADSNAPYDVRKAPAPDNWDRFNDDRNRILEGKGDSHVPPNIGLVSGELNDYGSWRNDSEYGWVWCPRGYNSDWRPYHDGRWTWVDPYGWTWVSNEPWGWAPYHYGTWVHRPYGWGWCPGPVRQYWSPAVVSFSVYDGNAVWAPLCPWEVRYPSFGYWGPSWSFSFSIGYAGCYYPYGGYCVGFGFNTFFVNHFDRFRDRDRFRDHNFARGLRSPAFNRFARTNEFAAANSHFVPFNASRASGASLARLNTFGGAGRYEALGRNQASYFSRGRVAAAPTAGRTPVGGPPSVAPTNIARTPTRTFTSAQPAQSVMNRSLYHAPTPVRTSTGNPITAGRGGSSIAAGVGRTNGSASSVLGSRTRTPSIGSRSGLGDSSVSRQPSRPADVVRGAAPLDNRQSTLNSRQSPTFGAGSRSNESRMSPAEAARQARSSLGFGSRSSGDYGAASRIGGGGSGGSRASGSNGDGYSLSRRPQSGSNGTTGRAADTGAGTGSAGRSSGSYRTYGGGNYNSGASSSRGYGGDYGTSRSRTYGGDSGSGRSGGGYSSGRAPSYGGNPESSRSGGYSGGRSGGSYSGGGSNRGEGSRSSGSYSGGGSSRSEGGRSGGSYSGGGGYSGGGRSSGGGGGYGGSRGRGR